MKNEFFFPNDSQLQLVARSSHNLHQISRSSAARSTTFYKNSLVFYSVRSIFRDFVSLALPIYMLNLISFDRARRAPLLSMSLRKYIWDEMRIKEKKKENEKRSCWTFQAARKARECVEAISVWGNRYVRTPKRGASRVRPVLEGEEHGSWVRSVWFVNKL